MTTADRRIESDVLRWPAERFYWADLDTTALGRAGAAPTGQQLEFIFEAALPVTLEQVQCAFVRVGPRRFIGCAVERAQIAAVTREHPTAMALTPAELPATLIDALGGGPDDPSRQSRDGGVDLDRLNMLAGAFEPPPVRRARHGVLLQSVAVAALLLAAVATGVALRRAALDDAARLVDAARRDRIVAALDANAVSGDSAQLPPELRLVSALRTLERASGGFGATSDDRSVLPIDASPGLAALLAAWPENSGARFESLTITDDSIAVRGIASGVAEAQRVADALGAMRGWRIAQPQFRTSRNAVSFTIDLRPVAETQTVAEARAETTSASGVMP